MGREVSSIPGQLLSLSFMPRSFPEFLLVPKPADGPWFPTCLPLSLSFNILSLSPLLLFEFSHFPFFLVLFLPVSSLSDGCKFPIIFDYFFFLPPTQSVKHSLFSPATSFSKQIFIECLMCVSGVWIQKWIKWKSKSCLCHPILILILLIMLFLLILRAGGSTPHHLQSVSYSFFLMIHSFQKILIVQKKNRENTEEKKEASDRKNRALN